MFCHGKVNTMIETFFQQDDYKWVDVLDEGNHYLLIYVVIKAMEVEIFELYSVEIVKSD